VALTWSPTWWVWPAASDAAQSDPAHVTDTFCFTVQVIPHALAIPVTLGSAQVTVHPRAPA
jgi:hypothetical protein